MSSKKKSKGFIVKREIADNGQYGSEYGFVKVQTPRPGETIYHGKFKSRTVYGGQYDAEEKTVYDYVGKGKPKTSVWEGEGDDSIEEF